VLGVPLKRRSYDSVDPTFDDSTPSINAVSKENFYKNFGPVIEANARYVFVYQKC
jgi:DnaJ family protein C protein 2